MGWGAGNLGGGSGGGLNFKVVGNPQPTSPKENTIWVNTDVPITSYVFSATQPTGSAGMVWITTGTYSPVAFNALKKNGIQVYPLSAKQYISGAWVDVTAKSYQGGEWVDWWDGTLYDSGDEYTSITGGWERKSGVALNSSCPNTSTAQKNADHLIVNGTANTNCGILTTKEKIDLTNFSIITIDNGSSGDMFAGIHTFDNGYLSPNASLIQWIQSPQKQLDISSLNGEFYISVGAKNGGGGKITKIKLS